MNDLYETDIARWSEEQSRLLRGGKLSEVDIENVAEEIESIGRREHYALWNHLYELLLHMLKWRYLPDRRNTSWRVSLAKHRINVGHILDDSPSLRASVPEVMTESYEDARRLAEVETGLAVFPKECPWTFNDAMAWTEE